MVRGVRHRDREEAMKAEIVIPWQPSDEHRGRAFDWVYDRLSETYPEYPIRLGSCRTDEPFNRSAAIVDAALRSGADTLIVHDADVLLSGDLREAVSYVELTSHWAVPHTHLRRLDAEATEQVYDGAALGPHLALDEPPYVGNPTGTLVVLPRLMVLDIPPDVRFKGWGQEDEAWGAALKRLAGIAWRGPYDLYHLWHPPAERRDRLVGSDAGEGLRGEYDRCARSVTAMRKLVDRSKGAWPDAVYPHSHGGGKVQC